MVSSATLKLFRQMTCPLCGAKPGEQCKLEPVGAVHGERVLAVR